MSLKEENNSWKCQHFPMEWEQINKISIKSIILGILFLNFNSKQARMYYSIPQEEKNILKMFN
jgi:hypothetical protein